MKTIIIITMAALITGDALAWSLFGYNTYEDCLLEESKKTNNNQAARLVAVACRKKFPMTYQECLMSSWDKIGCIGFEGTPKAFFDQSDKKQ